MSETVKVECSETQMHGPEQGFWVEGWCRCLGQLGCAAWRWYLYHVALGIATAVEASDVAWDMWMRQRGTPPLPTQKNIACCYWTHIPLKGKGKEWMEHLLNSTLCPFITILQHWWLLSLFQNYGNVFSAVMPASRATCVRFWRRQSGDAKYWKFLYVMFCFFTVGCRAR